MEDDFSVHPQLKHRLYPLGLSMFGVYDGHSGTDTPFFFLKKIVILLIVCFLCFVFCAQETMSPVNVPNVYVTRLSKHTAVFLSFFLSVRPITVDVFFVRFIVVCKRCRIPWTTSI